MCGICGFNWGDRRLAEAMAEAIRHRGPDDHATYADDGCSLGHRRLSIIDLSPDGRQPMSNEDGSVWIVFNGEIYNFPELRDRLLQKGHVFRSRSDTEVIVHAYEEYGVDCIRHLRGMFGFALWDRNRRQLLLVRDRIGIKPLYYYLKDGKLIFASEIKAILKDPHVPRRVNHQALYDYLGFEFVPAPETMFRDIYKIPAGHYLLWRDGQAEVREYWDLRFEPGPLASRNPEDAAREVMDLLDQCVKSHLISDVPLGVFLSGGLDSSSLVALMRRHISGPLRTFTIGYPDKTFSELDYAKIVADHCATEHHVILLDDLKTEDIEQSLWHFDEPMTDLSSIPLMMVCRKARRDVTVCLSGEGGDEVFAGYDRFKASKFDRYYSLLPRFVRRDVLGRLIRRLPDQPQKKGPINVLKRFNDGSILPPEGRHLRWQYFLNAELQDRLFSPAFKREVVFDPFRQVRDYDRKCDALDGLNRELYLDTRFMMADSVLMKVDKMSMASALEVRVPFLDHRFVELNAAIPGHWKLRGFRTKDLFRIALKGILPEAIIHRGKQGYSLPVKNLLRDQLREYMTDRIKTSSVIRENVNLAYVDQLIEEHLALKHNHNHVLWGLMHTAIWHQKFFGA
jgi:asparagine synthase (glutamine-hydrolysing)